MKPQVIQEISAEIAGKSHAQARELIKRYFAGITWSLEKDEWERMSEAQRTEFVKHACDSSAR